MTDVRTDELAVAGATIGYDLRGERGAEPPLLMFGAPMDGSGFTTLASHFADRVVVTYDPRNAGRSRRAEPEAAVSADEHVDDLHALVQALDRGPVDVFATSGGAVVALLLVERHSTDVRTLVAHEPPAAAFLPDRRHIRAVTDDLVATYDAHGAGRAMAKFIALVMHRGAVPPDYLDRAAPDPAAFGLPTADDGSRDHPLMANMRGGLTDVDHDVDALRAASTRIVVAVGEASGGPSDGVLAGRSAYAVAAALGGSPVVFPGGHTGFLSGEVAPDGRPTEFADRLREVLSAG